MGSAGLRVILLGLLCVGVPAPSALAAPLSTHLAPLIYDIDPKRLKMQRQEELEQFLRALYFRLPWALPNKSTRSRMYADLLPTSEEDFKAEEPVMEALRMRQSMEERGPASFVQPETEPDVEEASQLQQLAPTRYVSNRPRRSRLCMFNAGLGHNCDFKDAMGAVHESAFWGSGSPGRRRKRQA